MFRPPFKPASAVSYIVGSVMYGIFFFEYASIVVKENWGRDTVLNRSKFTNSNNSFLNLINASVRISTSCLR